MNASNHNYQENQVTRNPGPPRKNKLLLNIRTRIWYQSVMKKSDLNHEGLAVEFGDNSRKWRRYMNGESEPKQELINRVEERFPGTKRWYTLCELLNEDWLTEILPMLDESTSSSTKLLEILEGLETHPIIGRFIPDIRSYAENIFPQITVQKYAYETNEILNLQTIIWCRALIIINELDITILAKKFPPGDMNSLDTWRKFMTGICTPDQSLVECIEKSFSGTQKWFELPLSQLLNKTPIHMPQLKGNFIKVFHDYFPEDLPIIAKGFDSEKDQFWRIHTEEISVIFSKLSNPDEADTFSTFVSLCSVLALIREAETINDQNQHCAGFNAWCILAMKLITNRQLGKIFNWVLPNETKRTVIQEIHERIKTIYDSNRYFILENDKINTVSRKMNALEYVTKGYPSATQLESLFHDEQFRID